MDNQGKKKKDAIKLLLIDMRRDARSEEAKQWDVKTKSEFDDRFLYLCERLIELGGTSADYKEIREAI